MLTKWLGSVTRGKMTKRTIALTLSHDSVLLVRLHPEPLFLREACHGQSEWPKVIASLLDQAGGAGAQVHVVLNPSLVTQLQIEKPAVPDNEMAGALPWAIKDLVSEPVNQLICDYVDMPFNPTAKPRATVVCLLRNRVQAIADCINEKAHLLDITTEEFALVDLIGRSQRMELLLYRLPGQELSLMAVSEGQLCFSRQLRGFAINGLGRNESWPTEKFDELTLQIQRSLDYLMAQLKLGEAAQLYVAVGSPLLGPLVHHLADNFSFPVTALANGAVVVGLEYLPPYALLQGAEA